MRNGLKTFEQVAQCQHDEGGNQQPDGIRGEEGQDAELAEQAEDEQHQGDDKRDVLGFTQFNDKSPLCRYFCRIGVPPSLVFYPLG